ncbi:MAG: hypothetical protein WBO43_03200 [Gemmatimonadota bacterium]
MRGFKVLAVALSAVVAFTFTACDDQPTEPEQQAQFKPDKLGNGYPSTQFDYKLNIIGVPQDKSADMDNNNGRRIFVMLNGGGTVTNGGGKNNHLKNSDVNKIYLCNSTNGENDYNKDERCNDWNTANASKDFGVIDANATNSDGALFALPDPCADADSKTSCDPSYAIWARAKAGSGSATITTCAEEYYDDDVTPPDGYDIWCGDNGVTLSKQTAFRAVQVTDALLYMNITINGLEDDELATCVGTSTTGSETIKIYLFDQCFENYFWNYDNNGLKNLELRFYSD